MATDYSGRYSKPLGVNRHGFGGAGEDLSIEALVGETSMITVFDDFNGVVPTTTFGDATGGAATSHWTDAGWVLTDDASAPTGEIICMNDPVAGTNIIDFNSCLLVFPGTNDDAGGNMQLDFINADLASAADDLTSLSSRHTFPHLWIPETATIPAGGGFAGAAGDAGEGLDDTAWVFACRIGFRSDWTGAAGAGDWESKCFVGWAAAGDTSVIDHDTGLITDAAGNLHGFHICELGEINGVSKRITANNYTLGTNYIAMEPVGSVDNTVANGVDVAYATCWWDLALRMDISDMSDNDANGVTRFYSRRVYHNMPLQSWRYCGRLDNQCPNHTVALVPTIEVLNGPTAGRDGAILIDWWAMGRNRISR